MILRQQAFDGNEPMLKGCLHCHTTRSDGEGTPEDTSRYYYDHGYDFLAMTDHRIYNYNTYAKDLPLTVIPGMEFDNTFEKREGSRRTFHTVVIGPGKEAGNGFEQDERLAGGTATNQFEYQKYLDDFHARGNMTIYCHPEWSSTPARYFENMQGLFAMEIWNTISVVRHDVDKDAAYWDELLGQGKKIYGVASDDCHALRERCKGWVRVRSENNVSAILAALKDGKFYSSTGPEIYDFYVEDGVAVVKCSPCARIRFHSCMFPTQVTFAPDGETITEARIELRDHFPQYIRAVVVDEDGHHAWTNPIFFE